MNRVNLVKYGFVRWPKEDFSDDGNRFQCYRAGKNVRVSKLVADGQVYLSIDSTVGNGTLPYDTYSKLPYYNDANWNWNGVSLETLTDEDIQEFYNACIAYEAEYEKAEASIVYPTLEEIKAKAEKITAKTLLELNKLEQLFAAHGLEAATKFSTYEWKNIQDYIKRLVSEAKQYDTETFPQRIVGTAHSFDFVKKDTYMKESYWFRYIADLFKKLEAN